MVFVGLSLGKFLVFDLGPLKNRLCLVVVNFIFVVLSCVFYQELEEMKKRLKEMEEEAAALRDMQAKVEKEMGAVQGPYVLTRFHLLTCCRVKLHYIQRV